MSTLVDNSIVDRKVYRIFVVSIRGREILVDLIEVDIFDVDVILRMDLVALIFCIS